MDTEQSYITHGIVEDLSSLWDEIGFGAEEKQARLKKINHSMKKYLRKLQHEEEQLKKTLIEQIDHLAKEIYQLTLNLHKDIESIAQPGYDLSLLEFKAFLEEELVALESEAQHKKKLLNSLKNEEMMYCERLGEDPWDGPKGEIPSDEEIKYLRDILKTLEGQKIHREKKFKNLKQAILKSMSELQQQPSNSFERDIVMEVEEMITLSQSNLCAMKKLATDLETKIEKNKEREKFLKDQIQNLWNRLDINVEMQNAFTKNLTDNTVQNLFMLEEEFGHLEELKRSNLGKFIDQLRIDIKDWWEKCYVSDTEKQNFRDLESQEYSEDCLIKHEEYLKMLKERYEKYESVYKNLDKWCNLWGTVTKLEEKVNDPNRLFGNRGCSLLQEEKERKRVTKELPKLEKELQKQIRVIEADEKITFEVCGLTLEDFIKYQWQNYNEVKLQEKKERQEARTKQLLIDAKVVNTRSMKRSNPSFNINPATKFRRTGEHDRTPVKANLTKQGSAAHLASTRKRTLRDKNSALKIVEDTFQNSTCSYNRFTEGIHALSERENMRSSIVPGTRNQTRTPRGLPKTPIRTPYTPQRRTPLTLPRNFGRRMSPRLAQPTMTSRVSRTKKSTSKLSFLI